MLLFVPDFENDVLRIDCGSRNVFVRTFFSSNITMLHAGPCYGCLVTDVQEFTQLSYIKCVMESVIRNQEYFIEPNG